VDLNQVVKKLEPILRRTLTESQKLVLKLGPEVPAVRADPVQLDEVLLNLTINAWDAMPQGGVLTIETRSAQLTSEHVLRKPGVALLPGPFSVLTVTDTGHGMDRQTMEHLFEPFLRPRGWAKAVASGWPWSIGSSSKAGVHLAL